jgi:succinate-semialdehyde dehydrogenase/glutarate-semialdehyde dehydrogenase
LAHDEETFGPVLCVYKVKSVDEAVIRANHTRYGLHYAIATRNLRKGEKIAAQLEAGTVAVNDTYVSWAAMGAPMGGFKDSGIGRRHGPDGIRKYTEPQTISTNRTFWQIGSGETPLAINERLADALTWLLKIWRRIPFLR